jgi:2,4-dienoyl-CoA reductase-like NADH-dependent reductase (Old Yellow Enzyme family)
MNKLFSPLTIRGVTLPNRIVASPMCQYCAEDGKATSWHVAHLGQLAVSGAGMLCIESTSVEPAGRITPGDLGLWDDKTEASLKSVFEAIRKYSKIVVTLQLAHAGRKASSYEPWNGGQLIPVSDGGWETVGHSSQAGRNATCRSHKGRPPTRPRRFRGFDGARSSFGCRCDRTAWRSRLSDSSVSLSHLKQADRRIRRFP